MQTTSTNLYQNNINKPLSAVSVSFINEETMPSYVFNQNYNTLCVKATLGLGKTNALYDFLKRNLYSNYNSCLIISFRKLLCKKYHQDLPDFAYYEHINDSVIESSMCPFLICQVDSIKKIRGSYDLVIFDEVSYTMNHLISSVSSKKRCFDMIKDIMYEDNHMIFMDALFNEDWINYINSFNRKIHYIINEFSIHENKKIFNYGSNLTGFIGEIKKCIQNGDNIVIASNNKKKISFINDLLVNDFPNIKRLIIKKENNLNYDLNQWKRVQVLAYTPSIVAGISYTEKHFNKMFGIFCNSSSTADMALQQLFRVRDISSNEFHICCEVTGKNDYPVTDEEIKKMIIEEDKCLLTGMENITINYIKKDIVEDEYFNLFNIYQKIKFRSCNGYINELIKLLKEQGINNIIDMKKYDENDKKILLKQKKIFNKIVKETEAIRTENALDITDLEKEDIERRSFRTEDDDYILKKHKLKKILKIKNITKDIILKYDKKGQILWNLSYVFGYDNYRYQLINRIEYDEKKLDLDNDNTTRLGRKRKYEKMLLCDHVLKYIGFDGPLDTKYIDINKSRFKNYILKYSNIIEKYFKCNKFNIEVFNQDNWYKLAKIYINSKLKSVFNISIVDDKKNKKHYIKGLDFWDDESVTYKNPEIIEEIKVNEIDLFNKIDNPDYIDSNIKFKNVNPFDIKPLDDEEFNNMLKQCLM